MSPVEKKEIINQDHEDLSVVQQCKIISLSRSSYYYKGRPISSNTLKIMEEIDKIFTNCPFYGSRRVTAELRRRGHAIGRHRVRRLMRFMGLEAIYKKPNTSKSHPENAIYPYLLRDMNIARPNQVWCSDITYIPMQKGFLYLVAIMDWATRKVLSWRLSNTLHADFCVEALQEAIDKYGKPEIMNTDQGSQFTGKDWINLLKEKEVKISMDGRGRFLDNIFIERLWRSLKQEAVYLHELTNGFEARHIINQWMDFYNHQRPHSSLEYRTPSDVYFAKGFAGEKEKRAA